MDNNDSAIKLLLLSLIIIGILDNIDYNNKLLLIFMIGSYIFYTYFKGRGDSLKF